MNKKHEFKNFQEVLRFIQKSYLLFLDINDKTPTYEDMRKIFKPNMHVSH